MPHAGDRLYKDYVRKNMARLATQVKVREILPHLPCLTQSDKEEVEAKREMTGNYNAMQLLLDNLKRRENWPEVFIRALEECERTKLAQEIRDAYEALKAPNSSDMVPEAAGVTDSPGSVTMAHVHPLPSEVNVPTQPPVSASSPSMDSESASAPLHSPSAMSTPPPSRTTEPPSLPKMVSEAAVTPDVTIQPAPPSKTAAEAESPASTAGPPESPLLAVTQAEEARAPDMSVIPKFDIPDGPIQDVPSAEVLESPSLPPDPQPPTEEPASEPPQLGSIQETSPPGCNVNPLQQEPEETSDPTQLQVSTQEQPTAPSEEDEVQVLLHDTQNITPPAPAPASAPAPVSAPVVAMIHQPPPSLVDSDLEEEFFSKPNVLQSVAEGGSSSQKLDTVTECPETCSVTSDDLELSIPEEDSEVNSDSLVSSSANTDQCAEPVLQSDSAPTFTEANHTQESVTVKETDSPFFQEPAIEAEPPKTCSVTSEDLELSIPDGDSEVNSDSLVSSSANTDQCAEPVLQSDSAPTFTEANHTQESVTVKETDSLSFQEPAIEAEPPEICSVTSDDLKITVAGDSASEVNTDFLVSSRVITDQCVEAVLQSDSVPTFTEANHSQECVTVEENIKCSFQESTIEAEHTETCSVTSDDLEISTAAGDTASEGNTASSAASAVTDQCAEPVLVPDSVPSLTEANHTQEPVTAKENGSPSQPNSLLEDQVPCPRHATTEDQYEPVCSSFLSSQEQSTLVNVVHVSQDPLIQNEDGQEQSAASSDATMMVNHSNTQSEASLAEQQPTVNHHSPTPSALGSEVNLSPVKEEALGTEDNSSTKTEVFLERRENEAQAEEERHQEGEEKNEEQQGEVPLAGLLPVLQNVPLIPVATAVGVCALVFAWRLRN